MNADDPSGPQIITVSAGLPMESQRGVKISTPCAIEAVSMVETKLSTAIESGALDNEYAYRETDNAMFAWDQIHLALSANPPEPIPDWCMPILEKFSRELVNAKSVFRDKDVSSQEKGIKLAAMAGLDLGQQGKLNAVKSQDRWVQRAKDALHPPKAVAEWGTRTRRKTIKFWRWW